MSGDPVTIIDVAAAARVSLSTASRAINDHPHVRPETRARVLDAARRLHFQPSQAARALRTHRTSVIGLVVPDISSVFYAAALRAAAHTLRRQGYTLFIADTEEDADLEIKAIDALLTQRVAGLILAPVGDAGRPLRRALARYPAPVVTIDNRLEGVDADAVLLDNVEGARMLTAHLIGHGHRRIAYLGGLLRETSGHERLDGYRLALAAHALPFDARLAHEGDWLQESGARLMADALALPDPPTAVVVACQAMALGALQALRRAGRRVPDDVALVSFDDTPAAALLDPPLTTLESHDYDVGRLAAEMLLARLAAADNARGTAVRDGPGTGTKDIRLSTRLVARRSCGCP